MRKTGLEGFQPENKVSHNENISYWRTKHRKITKIEAKEKKKEIMRYIKRSSDFEHVPLTA